MSGEKIQLLFTLITSGVSLIGVLFLVYEKFTKPDIRSANKISLIEQGCVLKHKSLDDNINSIMGLIQRFEDNHMNHIEPDLKQMRLDINTIMTILKERERSNQRVL